MKPPVMRQCVCGNIISVAAPACPKCGHPFAPPKESVSGGVFKGLFAFFVLLPICIVGGMLGLGAVGVGCDSFMESKRRQVESEAAAKRAIAEERARKEREEYEQSPEFIAAKEKEATDRAEQMRRADAERAERQRAIDEEMMRPIRERTAKIIAYQLTQASNGLPSFQFEIGRRYLKGDGVETNALLARHWLHAAATNGLESASNLLSSLKPH